LKLFDSNGLFRVNCEGRGLRRRAVRNAGVTVFSQGVVFVVQMLSTVILARLLMPSDFGVVTMVTTFSLLLSSFGQNGYNEAIIQRSELTNSLASNLFWINVTAGFFMMVAFAAAGSLLARFYSDARVTNVAIAIAPTIFISNSCIVHLSLLKRAMRFSVTSANEIFAGAFSVIVMIALAWIGKGYWALVGGALARSLMQATGAFLLCRWIPSLPSSTNGTRNVASFATHVYGRFSINYFARNADNLLVGWRFGSVSLGFYKKAYDLFVLPANQLLAPIADVVLATLSRLDYRTDQYRRYLLNGLSILAFVGMGIGGCLTLEGKDFIRLLLGPKWTVAGQIFTYFGPGIGIMMIYSQNGLMHLSIGRADRWLRWIVVEFMVTGSLFLAGLRFGPAGIALAWTISFWILTVPAFWYAGRPIDFSVIPIIGAVWRYVASAAVAGCFWAAIMHTAPPALRAPGLIGALVRISINCSMFLVLYVAVVVLLYGNTEPIRRLVRLAPDLLPGRRVAETQPLPEPAVAASQSD
jgi:O-antigen/teichoic acid export membrane protein